MKTTENTTMVDKAVDFLRKAAVELEELQVQASLGKAELQDAFEDTKKDFNRFVHDSKTKVQKGQETYEEIKTMFEELMLQLALGKAETIDAFKEQKKNILSKLHDIEVKIKTNETLNKVYNQMLIEIDKFKVKLDILENNLEDTKANFKTTYNKGKQEFMEFVEKFKSDHEAQKEETQWEHFQGEISEAFRHFKQAFSKS
jgi:arsenate reductase-like glutaredoxin family protein